jgi:transcriptional regulator with XRE-family HTH domain
MVNVGRWVRRIRRERELSQAALAERAGMAKNSINKIERGHMNPSSESVVRLANAMDVPVATLYAEEPELALPKSEAPPPQTLAVAGPADEDEYGSTPTLKENFVGAFWRLVEEKRALGLDDEAIEEDVLNTVHGELSKLRTA